MSCLCRSMDSNLYVNNNPHKMDMWFNKNLTKEFWLEDKLVMLAKQGNNKADTPNHNFNSLSITS